MKNFLLIVILISSFTCCIKKKAVRAEPNLIGTWVGGTSVYSDWLIISSDGHGIYRNYGGYGEDFKFEGKTKYSLFESKLYVGSTKFKVISPISGNTVGVTQVVSRDYESLNTYTYNVNMKMVLKTSFLHSSRTIEYFKVVN